MVRHGLFLPPAAGRVRMDPVCIKPHAIGLFLPPAAGRVRMGAHLKVGESVSG